MSCNDIPEMFGGFNCSHQPNFGAISEIFITDMDFKIENYENPFSHNENTGVLRFMCESDLTQSLKRIEKLEQIPKDRITIHL